MKNIFRSFSIIVLMLFVGLLVSCNNNEDDKDFITNVYYNEQNELIVNYNSGKVDNLSAIDTVVELELIDGDLVITYLNEETKNIGNIIGPKGLKGDDGREVFLE